MSDIRLFEGELNIMELLWSNDILAAKDIAKIIKEYVGWEKNTTYTVINRLIKKGAIIRIGSDSEKSELDEKSTSKSKDSGFLCKAAVDKKTVQITETQALLDKVYNGSLLSFFTEYLKNQKLDNNELLELAKILREQNVGIKK